MHTGGGARNQFNPGLTQFSPNRGFNPGGRLNLPTLYECQMWLQSDGRVERGGGVQIDIHTHKFKDTAALSLNMSRKNENDHNIRKTVRKHNHFENYQLGC